MLRNETDLLLPCRLTAVEICKDLTCRQFDTAST